MAASKESSAVPNGTSRGRKYLSQLLWTLLSYFLRKAWEVPNLLLLLMAGDNSRCTALGIFLQDLVCSFEWGQQMHFPRSSVHSLDEKLPTVPVFSKGQLWKRPCCEETGKVWLKKKQQQSWTTTSDWNLRFYSQFTETFPHFQIFSWQNELLYQQV